MKPLRYDAKSAAAFANAVLLDVGRKPLPLHLVSAFKAPGDRAIKERSVAQAADLGWVWRTDQKMPPLPKPVDGAPCRLKP